MIWTSSHKDGPSSLFRTFAISGNKGEDADYKGACYPALAPKFSFWKQWHDNIGKIPEEENNRYYVEEYWKQVLSKLDPEKVYKELDYSTLLCYEPNTEFCHRHIVAAWLEILLDIHVPEIKVTGYSFEEVERPEYIKQYLEDAMRATQNMKGFKSLRALYLYNQSEELEKRADELAIAGEDDGKCRQEACFLRSDADMAEDKYKQQHLKRLREKYRHIE